MSLKPVFTAIKAQLLATVSNESPFNSVNSKNVLSYVQMWNNQLASWRDSFKEVTDSELVTGNNNTYIPAFPALLVEFDNLVTEQLGGGYQIYSDLVVRIHIVHQQLDAGDGTMEQNLDVYDLADAVYQSLQKFKPAGCIEFIRQKQFLDSAHDNLYHYIIEFGTNYVDGVMAEPVGGKSTTIKNLELDVIPDMDLLGDESGNDIVDENGNEIAT